MESQGYAGASAFSGTVNIRTATRELFSDQAEKAAKSCIDPKNKMNKTSQLRRLYDELVMWNDKVFSDTVEENQNLRYLAAEPYIQMLRAKAAYAKSRELINDQFLNLFVNLIRQIDSPKTLRNARLFMEAFMAFKKLSES